MVLDLILEILGTLIGMLYLYWEYQANQKMWIAGIIMPAISLWVYWKSGLYADFAIHIYYLLAAIYGFWWWRRISVDDNHASHEGLSISHVRASLWPFIVVVCLLCWLLIRYMLTYTDSDVAGWDAFTTALSLVGMWMLARKWVEQWGVWIAVDVISTGLYLHKQLYFYALLYAIYTIVAFFGYRKWLAMMGGKK